MNDELMVELGPIDYLVVEFPAGKADFSGAMAEKLMALVEAGTVRVLDLLIITKDEGGEVDAFELHEFEGERRRGAHASWAPSSRSCSREEDVGHIAAALEPGTVAAALVWENTWAAPFAVVDPRVRRPAGRQRPHPHAGDPRRRRGEPRTRGLMTWVRAPQSRTGSGGGEGRTTLTPVVVGGSGRLRTRARALRLYERKESRHGRPEDRSASRSSSSRCASRRARRVTLAKDFDPGYKAGFVKKKDGLELLAQGVELLSEYQERLAAQDTHGVLVVLQALDAAGKDGTIRHVMSGVNPQGVSVHSFKAPSPQELDHDYLWRFARNLPAPRRDRHLQPLLLRGGPRGARAPRDPPAPAAAHGRRAGGTSGSSATATSTTGSATSPTTASRS